MSYLLDTNAVIAALENRPARVLQKLAQHLLDGVLVYASSITMFELWYGVMKSEKRDENTARLEVFAGGKVEILPFDREDARVAGEIRDVLRRRGTPIGPYDLLIAAQALRRDAMLVTANIREFSRIDGLRHEDWSVPER